MQIELESCEFCEKHVPELELEVSVHSEVFYFCSWVCVMAFAATRAQKSLDWYENRVFELESQIALAEVAARSTRR